MSAKTSKRARQRQKAADLQTVTDFLRGYMTKLRQEFARRLKIQRQHFPKMKLPCETCAFRTSADFTDGQDGFVVTTGRFVHAMASGAMFYCHEPEKVAGNYQPRFNKKLKMLEPCAGWWVLNSTTPEPLDIREFLGDEVVDVVCEMDEASRTTTCVMPEWVG